MMFSLFMDLSAKSKQWSFFLLGSSVLLSIFLPPKASALTFVPGKSLMGLGDWDRIERILDKHPRLKEQVKNQLHSYYFCRYEKVLEKEKKEKSKLCTDLYRTLVQEKIWFQDKMLWEIVNTLTLTKRTPKGRVIDPKTGKTKKYTISCSKEFLTKTDRKTRKDVLLSLGEKDFDSVSFPLSNDHLIYCNQSAKEGSQSYRRWRCLYPLSQGEEDERMGLLVGKYCRDNFPEFKIANRYTFRGVDPVENRKKIQRKIARELVKFKSEEKRSFKSNDLVHKDLMSDKYSLKDKKFYCMDAAVNDFADEPKFYKKYCNKLMK